MLAIVIVMVITMFIGKRRYMTSSMLYLGHKYEYRYADFSRWLDLDNKNGCI